MKRTKRGFNYAVKKELQEAMLLKAERYINTFIMIWVMGMMIAWCLTNAYVADLNFQSYALEQSMNTSLWYRVMVW